jgi:hypothetical protein
MWVSCERLTDSISLNGSTLSRPEEIIGPVCPGYAANKKRASGTMRAA